MKKNKIRILVMDVDGTLTDGKIYMGHQGEAVKAFNIKDGYAVYSILPEYSIIPVIITGRSSGIVEERCRELDIFEVHQGCLDKQKKIYEIADKYGLAENPDGKISGVAYIGDDILDIPGMKISEVAGCPADAAEEVKELVHYVCKNKGGEGALREFVEWFLKFQQK